MQVHAVDHKSWSIEYFMAMDNSKNWIDRVAANTILESIDDFLATYYNISQQERTPKHTEQNASRTRGFFCFDRVLGSLSSMPEIRRTKAVLSRQQWKEMQTKRQEEPRNVGVGVRISEDMQPSQRNSQ